MIGQNGMKKIAEYGIMRKNNFTIAKGTEISVAGAQTPFIQGIELLRKQPEPQIH